MRNVLYVGMENDIVLPFLIEPDFDNLYVINENDVAYGTWEEQIDEILSILENGSDEFIEKPEEHPITGLIEYKVKSPFAKLPEGPCKILYSNTKEAKKFELVKIREHLTTVRNGRVVNFEYFLTKDKKQYWEVIFEYGGKVRTLTYYLRDFYDVWPREVKNIDALIWIGAFIWQWLTGKETVRKYNVEGFRKNIEKRCNLPLTIYSGDKFIDRKKVITSKYHGKRGVSRLILNNFKDGWWKKHYSLKV